MWQAALAAINLCALSIVGYDKGIAGTNSMRVPEKVFYTVAALGGSIGVLLGMQYFRHKTKKASFQFAIGLIFLIQLLAVVSFNR